MEFGRYYEDFEIDAVYKHWPGRTIGEADDTWFSVIRLNQNPLHIDEHYASKLHGQRLVNGLLVLSIAVGMSVADVSGKAKIGRASCRERVEVSGGGGTWRKEGRRVRQTRGRRSAE